VEEWKSDKVEEGTRGHPSASLGVSEGLGDRGKPKNEDVNAEGTEPTEGAETRREKGNAELEIESGDREAPEIPHCVPAPFGKKQGPGLRSE
jgi:hypothetical protein